MKVTNILMGIVICGAVSDTVSAGELFRSRATGSWNVYTTWEYFIGDDECEPTDWTNAPVPGGSGAGYDYPGSSDRVKIDDYIVTVNVSTAACDSFRITDDGILKIGSSTANGKLTVNGGCIQTHSINGSLVLGNVGGSRTGVLLFTTENQTLRGNGQISGVVNGSKIQIANGLTLANKTSIVGIVKIEAETNTATLYMDGALAQLVADRAGDLELAANLIVTEPGSGDRPTYASIASGSSLKFLRSDSAYSLRGNFALGDCAAVLFIAEDAEVVTDGTFTDGASGGPDGLVDFEVNTAGLFEWASGNINVDTDFCP